MRLRHALTAVLAAVVVAAAGSAAAAGAAPRDAADPGTVAGADTEVRPMAHFIVKVGLPRTSLFQCPGFNCNQGEASPHHDTRMYCKLATGSPWRLIFNATNGHVGWVEARWLNNPPVPPNCLGSGLGTKVKDIDRTLNQCPHIMCNRGVAGLSHDIAVLCKLTIGTINWRFVVNQTNKHVGWIESFFLNPDQTAAPPCVV